MCASVCALHSTYTVSVYVRARGERKVISTFAAAAAAEVPFLLLSVGRSEGKVFRVAIGSIRCGEKKGERGREHTCCYYCCCCSQLHEYKFSLARVVIHFLFSPMASDKGKKFAAARKKGEKPGVLFTGRHRVRYSTNTSINVPPVGRERRRYLPYVGPNSIWLQWHGTEPV